jgi:hypothetical protein
MLINAGGVSSGFAPTNGFAKSDEKATAIANKMEEQIGHGRNDTNVCLDSS